MLDDQPKQRIAHESFRAGPSPGGSPEGSSEVRGDGRYSFGDDEKHGKCPGAFHNNLGIACTEKLRECTVAYENNFGGAFKEKLGKWAGAYEYNFGVAY